MREPRVHIVRQGTGTPQADEDRRLDPTIDTTDPVELSAKLRGMYVMDTGIYPAGRGCYPATRTPFGSASTAAGCFRTRHLAVSETRVRLFAEPQSSEAPYPAPSCQPSKIIQAHPDRLPAL